MLILNLMQYVDLRFLKMKFEKKIGEYIITCNVASLNDSGNPEKSLYRKRKAKAIFNGYNLLAHRQLLKCSDHTQHYTTGKREIEGTVEKEKREHSDITLNYCLSHLQTYRHREKHISNHILGIG